MTDTQPGRRYRFGTFEVDAASGELRRQGIRVRINAQPFQLLVMLLERPCEVISREEIERALWPEGTFVDYEHGVNSAVNRIREALGDTASNPRFVETLARRGYRFVAPVEKIREQGNERTREREHRDTGAEGQREREHPGSDGVPVDMQISASGSLASRPAATFEFALDVEPQAFSRILAAPEDLPKAPQVLVQTLFILFQLMYLTFYIGALANLPEIEELLSSLARPVLALDILIVTAAILIPVRAFVLCAVLFHAPRIHRQFMRLWPFLLLVDVLWALSPFLLLHHINVGLALACMALLVYSPFAQRSLVLMGAGSGSRNAFLRG